MGLVEFPEALFAACGNLHPVAISLQGHLEHFQGHPLIINHQDGGHGCLSVMAVLGGATLLKGSLILLQSLVNKILYFFKNRHLYDV